MTKHVCSFALCSANRTFTPKSLVNTIRLNSGDARGSFSRQAARRRTVKEAAMAPSEGIAINLDRAQLLEVLHLALAL